MYVLLFDKKTNQKAIERKNKRKYKKLKKKKKKTQTNLFTF
jgi:hypothetical protein